MLIKQTPAQVNKQSFAGIPGAPAVSLLLPTTFLISK